MIRKAVFLLAFPLFAAAAARPSANIKGRVLDWATDDALQLVEVKLVVSGTVYMKAYTDKNGEYTIVNSPAGTFTLEFRKRGFEYFPTIVSGKTTKTEIVMPDTFLLEKNATSLVYYNRAAQKLVEHVRKRQPQGGPDAHKEYARAWSQLGLMKIAPSGRAAYARTLTEVVPEIVRFKLPKLDDYAGASPDAVQRFQSETERAVLGGAQLTNRVDLKQQGINDALILDVAAYVLDESTAPVSAKQEFVAKFGRNYGLASEKALHKAVEQDIKHAFPPASTATGAPEGDAIKMKDGLR